MVHTDVPILILGESGVGKEIVARYIHTQSRREACWNRNSLTMSLGHSPARKGRTGGDLEYFVEKYRVQYKSRVAELPEGCWRLSRAVTVPALCGNSKT